KNWVYMKDEEKHEVTVQKGGFARKDVDSKKICEVVEEVGYWRKANAVHSWFVTNVQKGIDNCESHYVSKDQLKELLNICTRLKNELILEDGEIENGYTIKEGIKHSIIEKGKIIKNPELAEELLPVKEGFFFGATDYNKFYYEDIVDTVDILTPLVNEEYEGSIYYRSSW